MINLKILRFFLPLFSAVFLINYSSEKLLSENLNSDAVLNKITFDISAISPDGLIGPIDGLRTVSYEFCIPANPQFLATIQTIDPTVDIYRNSPGRIRCQNYQYLCIGHTHNRQWKDILLAISQLDYVEKINEFYGE
ncbi:hypothetical protein VB715_16405 [Crocosphaera sp. UHCC 0190]|uniref:hypothetical protein n=1 Tax=Crocosphaera sp. UHCC 0190 TaxID=3110246 RepID=UPI002B1F3571|nr:hypothetical protein [Crocosphaera sp. UHCC 0190]MEA5511357.1 hypothetical protein [Crocosphaera sp. UHCC 0190]